MPIVKSLMGPSWSWWYDSWIYIYLCNQCLSPLWLWVRTLFIVSLLNTTLCNKVCQWLAICMWFSPGTPVSSTIKIDRHDITEILFKVALNTINQSNHQKFENAFNLKNKPNCCSVNVTASRIISEWVIVV